MVIRLLLISMLLFSNVARAEYISPRKMTVSEFYSLNNRVGYLSEFEWSNFYGMNGYLLGIRDFNADKYFMHGDNEAAICIDRPLNVWLPLVLDKYKLNKIKGDEIFYIKFIETIDEVCEVKLW